MAQRLASDSKRDYRRFLRPAITFIAVAIFLPTFFGAAQAFVPRGVLRPLVVIALFVCEAWPALFIHELGHAVGALLVGWRVHVFSVVPFAFQVKSKRFISPKRFTTGDLGGFVLATPPMGGDWRRGEKGFIIGGIAANLLSSLIAFALVFSNALEPRPEAIAWSFGVLSLVVALMNLVPFWGPDTLRSDGAQLLDSMRGRRDPVAERLAWLLAMRIDGLKAADFDREIVSQIEADLHDGKIPHSAYPLLHSYYLMAGDPKGAHAVIKRIVATDQADWAKVEHALRSERYSAARLMPLSFI